MIQEFVLFPSFFYCGPLLWAGKGDGICFSFLGGINNHSDTLSVGNSRKALFISTHFLCMEVK